MNSKYINKCHAVSYVVAGILILMIILFNFSQMIMETWAYSFMISENDKTIKVIQANDTSDTHLAKKHKESDGAVKEICNTKISSIKGEKADYLEDTANKDSLKNTKNKDYLKNKTNKDSLRNIGDNGIKQIDDNSVQNVSNTVIQLRKPVSGGVTTSVFGDVVDRRATHLGHDWAVEVGTSVCAAADGTVEKAYLSDSYGYNILVNHGNGLKTRYAHLSKILINLGDTVEQGRIIGLSGNTGDSTGPHLHFEVIQNDKHVNPLNFLK